MDNFNYGASVLYSHFLLTEANNSGSKSAPSKGSPQRDDFSLCVTSSRHFCLSERERSWQPLYSSPLSVSYTYFYPSFLAVCFQPPSSYTKTCQVVGAVELGSGQARKDVQKCLHTLRCTQKLYHKAYRRISEEGSCDIILPIFHRTN